MRGHLHANLDPLGIARWRTTTSCRPRLRLFRRPITTGASSSTTLGLEFATIREMLAILKRTYVPRSASSSHISDPAEKA